MRMRFLLVCTGTAGHINPALGIAAQLKKRIPQSELLFVGADRAMEKRLIPEAGYELVNIKMSGLRRSFKPKDIFYNINTLINTVIARRKSNSLLKNFKPDAVIGTGGYIYYPVLSKAVKLRIPSFIHESNANPGLTVKMLSQVVDKVFIAFKNTEHMYKKPKNVIYTGTPLRKEFYDAAETDEISKSGDKPLVVSFWGSLGAERMNDMMPEFIKRNLEDDSFRHIHATGSSADRMISRLGELGITDISLPMIELREYIDNMPTVMKAADMILCRSGGITCAELIALGKPAVLIPSLYVPDNIQSANAEQLSNPGGAVVISEKDLTGGLLFEIVSELLNDKEKLERMSLALKALSVTNSAEKIVDIVVQHLGGISA